MRLELERRLKMYQDSGTNSHEAENKILRKSNFELQERVRLLEAEL